LPALSVAVSACCLVLSGCDANLAALRPYTITDTEAAANAVFPDYVTERVKAPYEFALARPDVLKYLPCYCACGPNLGHASVLSCFIVGGDLENNVHFDDHGALCYICLETVRDAERLLGEGKDLSQIRAHIDQAYSRYGAGTDTPQPPPWHTAADAPADSRHQPDCFPGAVDDRPASRSIISQAFWI